MRTRFMTISLVLTILGSSFAGFAGQSGQDLWMSGFSKFMEGVEAEKGGNDPLALRLFQEAAQDMEKVKTDFPEWQPSVVSFRLAKCQSRIKVLNTRLAEKESDLSKDELITLNQTLKAQVADLEEKAVKAMEELELQKAKVQPADTAEMAEKLAALEEENKLLLTANAEVSTSKKEKKLAGKIDELEAEITEMEAVVEANEKALKAANKEIAKGEKLSKEISGLQDIAVELDGSLAKMAEEKEAMRKELTGMLAERKEMAGELKKLSAKLQSLQKTSEKLRQQNEDLRDQLK